MFSRNKTNVSVRGLLDIPLVRPPGAGKTWRGVPHHDLISALTEGAVARGWKIQDTRLHVGRGGADLTAALLFKIPKFHPVPKMSPSLGIVTSNARRNALKGFVGLTGEDDVSVVTGVLQTRTHTVDIDLKAEVEGILDEFRHEADLFSWTSALFQTHLLEQEETAHILMRAGMTECMPWSRVGRVYKQYRSVCRRKNQFIGTTNNAWTLALAFGSVVRMNPAADQIVQLAGFYKIIEESIRKEKAA